MLRSKPEGSALLWVGGAARVLWEAGLGTGWRALAVFMGLAVPAVALVRW